ncbi:MAG: hypothetical protein WBG71_04380 [Leeuwenhoekiella sp.]
MIKTSETPTLMEMPFSPTKSEIHQMYGGAGGLSKHLINRQINKILKENDRSLYERQLTNPELNEFIKINGIAPGYRAPKWYAEWKAKNVD